MRSLSTEQHLQTKYGIEILSRVITAINFKLDNWLGLNVSYCNGITCLSEVDYSSHSGKVGNITTIKSSKYALLKMKFRKSIWNYEQLTEWNITIIAYGYLDIFAVITLNPPLTDIRCPFNFILLKDYVTYVTFFSFLFSVNRFILIKGK